MTIYSLDVLLSQFCTSLLFHVRFCFFLSHVQVSQETGKVIWYSHLFKNFPQFAVLHIVKGFWVVNKAEIDIFLEFSCFFYDPTDVGNLISGTSAFSKSSLNIGSSQFMYGWSLAWRILSLTLKYVKWVQLCETLNIFWHCLSLAWEWKLIFSSPVAMAELSKFDSILSVAL